MTAAYSFVGSSSAGMAAALDDGSTDVAAVAAAEDDDDDGSCFSCSLHPLISMSSFCFLASSRSCSRRNSCSS